MSQDIYFHQAHFCRLSSQSNVYGMTKLGSNHDQSFKILVSSGKTRQITCIGFQRDEFGFLKPFSRELELGDLSIPDGVELLCLDAFKQDEDQGASVLGFCFTKEHGIDNTVQWLNISNIISSQCDDAGVVFDAGAALMPGLGSVELDYGCLFLKHKLIECNGKHENVCIMSGDDGKIHVSILEREDYGSNVKCSEFSCEDFFPELQKLPGCVLCLDFCEFGKQRITAVGCDNGVVILSLTDVSTLNVERTWTTKHDHPVLVVKLFCHVTPQETTESDVTQICHLMATSVTTPAVVYRDVLQNGFSSVKILPNSNDHDLVMCACIADIDWDGQKELLLGTSGHSLLIYKWFSDEKDKVNMVELSEDDHSEQHEEDDLWLPVEEYRLVYERIFPHSVMALEYADLTGDGLCELVVLSNDGVRILQHNLDEAAKVLMKRLGNS